MTELKFTLTPEDLRHTTSSTLCAKERQYWNDCLKKGLISEQDHKEKCDLIWYSNPPTHIYFPS
jgi:hypothetical protein